MNIERRRMNNKGQASLSEYVMIFFVVIAAIVAMTVFVQRSLEGRIHDARNFMISSIADSKVCDTNCLNATGGSIANEYEPYYSLILSDVQQNAQENSGLTQGNSAETGSKYIKNTNDLTQTIATSKQLPPQCASYPNGGCPYQ
jgi:hypothetical protein